MVERAGAIGFLHGDCLIACFFFFSFWHASSHTHEHTQPPDGVRRYEQFEATVTVVTHFSSSPLQPGDVVAVNADEESFEHGRKMHGIPTGTWRDGLCDCGTLGCCHPVCCCTLWCAPVALGQILTRLRLDCCGRPPPPPSPRGRRSTSPVCSPCIACAYLYIPLLLLVGGFTMAIDSYDATLQPRQQLPWEYHLLYYARLCLVLVWSLFFVLAVARTRSWIRRQYGIPEDTACEGGCEDCCCACFCTGCTICQMARHTANFRDFNATCCTENGLEGTAPDVV